MIHYKITDRTGIRLHADKPGILNKKLMHDIGQAVRATVYHLTSQGKDYRGKAFARYSTKRMYVPLDHKPKPKGGRRKHLKTGRPLKTVAYDLGYRQYRVAHGRSTKPDLQFTGKMLSAFQIVKVSQNRVKLGFVNKQEEAKAIGNITGIRGRRQRRKNPRRFIGIGSDHEAAIFHILAARVREFSGQPAETLIRRIS